MRKAFRVWIEVEEYDAADIEGGGENVALDFEHSATFVARDDSELARSRARDRAVGFAERLHELATATRGDLERAS